MHDSQLLDDYVTRNSETAFQSLVTRYLNLVRSTALRQVPNAPLAEEVAQAVFILLARKAARLRKTKNLVLGGWLYRTTRFVAARALRGELRRRRREQEAFQMQQISSTDETWRRIAPVLDEGIEQLGQTDRDAVLLRFFQDEPLQKVGAALGISEEAARKRVSRSIEKLRVFFGRRGFTISTTMLASALASHRAEAAPAGLAGAIGAKALSHAAPSTAPLPALVAETLAAWQWAMVKILAASGVAATAAVLVVAQLWTSPVRPSPTSTAAGIVPKTVLAAKQSSAPAQPETNTAWRFAFQAVDAVTGKGIGKARIMVVSAKEMSQLMADPQQVDLQTNLATDENGRCDIGLPYPNPLLFCVGVLADGYEERCLAGNLRDPVPDSYVLKIPRGSRLGGVVQDESGQPVAGAGIYIRFYGFDDVSGHEFQRERPGFFSHSAVTMTDRAGRWSFGSGPTNADFRLAVIHPDFPPTSFQNDDDPRNPADAATVKLDELRAGKAVLVLKAGLTLRGVVTDEHGYNLAGAKVYGEWRYAENHGSTTETDGSFILSGLEAGSVDVTVTADGFAPQRIPVQVSSNTAPLAVQLKPAAVLRVRVEDQTGSPLPGARVGLDQWQGPNAIVWGALTDSDGRAVWKSAPIEPITLSVIKDGWFSSRENAITADGEEHILTLCPPLTVVGRVTDAATKQPIASFKAIAEPERFDFARGSNGQYELAITEHNQPLTLRIEASGYEPATSEPLNFGAANFTCDFQLKKLAPKDPIQGEVLLPDGSAIAGVEVALCQENAVEMGKARFVNPDHAIITRTDADGHFSFAAASAGRAVVAVHQEGFATVAVTPTNHSVSIQLQPWGRIQGVVRLKTRPNAGQQIILSTLPVPVSEGTVILSSGAYTTKTDEQGTFAFDQVPPGQFYLYMANLNEPFNHLTPVQIQPGATAVVQIGGTGEIVSGRLVLSHPGQTIDWSKRLIMPMLQNKLPYPAGLGPLQRAEWWEMYSNSEEGRASIRSVCNYPLTVQADGTFTTEDVPPGDYELSGRLSDTTVDLSRGVLGHIIGSFRQDVTVPQSADAQSSEKIDLGTVPVQTEKP
jgi:RNA polymerase sigma factor (sigma-70 family)